MLYVGIDWADLHHDVCLTDDSAKTLSQFQIANNSEGFSTVHKTISKYEPVASNVFVAIETKRGLLVYDLLCHNYNVYAINPKAVNRYKDRHLQSKAKSDKVDALSMAHLLRTDRHCFKPLILKTEDYRLLERLCMDLRNMIDDKTRLVNQVTACLKEYYPQAVKLFSRTDSKTSISFLKTFPDPKTLLSTSKRQFLKFFNEVKYTWPSKVESLYKALHSQVRAASADPVVERAARMRMLALIEQLETLKEHQARYEEEIKELLNSLPEGKTMESLPGVDKRLAPELVAALGPRVEEDYKRFSSAEEIKKVSGCAPITKSSGKWKSVNIRRACDKRLRRTFYDWAMASISSSRWARAYYDWRKGQKHRHTTILRSLGGKWAKIVYAMWEKGEEYEEERHIEDLKKNKVEWAMGL